MAVTKTHPIKSTLKAAIDYICNPDKTDGRLLVSSFGCTAETADIEFAWTRRHAIDKGTNLGRHLIQAFEPGEVTPEEAHRIGMELARAVLGGKYEFVLTTHIDRDHVHNHLIFNAVSFQDHRHYHSNKRSYHEIRRTSDRICKEHGLSVIVPGLDKGKSYIEHQAAQNGTSYKAKMRSAIDRLLPGCTDLEDLLRRLQREGYELKRGKYISARAPGQERFTRLKTLGADYAEEALTARIVGRSSPSRQPKQRTGWPSLLIDLQNNIKAQQSAGYKHWATIENLKRAAETLNFLTEHGIGSLEELSERCDGAAAATARVKADLRTTEKEMERLTLTMKHAKFINGSNGTVLYRGQNQKYDNLKPSGARDKKKAVSSALIEKALKDADILNYFKLDVPEIDGWKKYQEIIIEAALQHYGGKTYCMDFVDNHWCALWFGLYKFNPDGTYAKRSDKEGFLYIFLYLADTNGANIRGLYIGDEVYTVDLRKAMPSYFLRPASQHGWVVRKKERKDDCDYKDNVLCVIKIKVEDADNWLGSGALLSQENFFPDYSIDEGYGVLLSRQERSGVYKPRYDLIFPPKTIQNYHHSNEYFVSDKAKKLQPVTPVNYLDEDGKEHPIDSINTLYALLLEKGWSQESSENEMKWSSRNPCTYQSAATALLVQDIFGGEILRYNRKGKSHYFNYTVCRKTRLMHQA